MKKLSLFVSLFITAFTYAQQSPVAITIGGTPITLAEFEAIFNKNNLTNEKPTRAAIDEYLDLFINFKLKVHEARQMGMDTTKEFKAELSGYRKQLAMPYLKDKKAEEELIAETHRRLTKDLKVRHILIKTPKCLLPEDTITYYKKALDIRSKIGRNLSFEKAAELYSEDEFSAKLGGDLGYFTGLMWSYPFETAAYNTKVGQISRPVRTNYGYHLILVEDERPARGEVRVAHILIRADRTNPQSIQSAKDRIDDIYAMLRAGTPFSELAGNYSEDANSKGVGGELPLFGINKMVPEFEDVAFSLRVNEYSEPFLTDIGYHIVRVLDKKEIAPLDKSRDEILKKIQRNVRYTELNNAFAAKLQKEYGFVENKKALQEIQKLVKGTERKLALEDLRKISNLELFKLAGAPYNLGGLLDANQSKLERLGEVEYCDFVNNYYHPYIVQKTLDFEDSRLEKKYPEFDALMKEYTDGILLFNLMDKKVWSKSVEDTTGLRAFFNANRQNYMWEERAETLHFSVKDEKNAKKMLKEAQAIINGKKTLDAVKAKYNKKSSDVVYVDKKLYLKGENKEVDALNFAPGIGQLNQKDGRFVFTAVVKIRPKEPKALNETKGLVISDYQNFLDTQWIKELREKYKVEVNKDVLYSIVQ